MGKTLGKIAPSPDNNNEHSNSTGKTLGGGKSLYNQMNNQAQQLEHRPKKKLVINPERQTFLNEPESPFIESNTRYDDSYTEDDANIDAYRQYRDETYREGRKFEDIQLGFVIIGGEVKDYRGYTPDNLVIPEGVTSIGDYVLSGKTMKSVTLPSTLEHIGKGSFRGCTDLETVTFANDCNLKDIDNEAFKMCTSLREFDFEDGLETIGNRSFFNTGLEGDVTIPDSVASIDNEAFMMTPNMRSLSYDKHTCTSNNVTNHECRIRGSKALGHERDRNDTHLGL